MKRIGILKRVMSAGLCLALLAAAPVSAGWRYELHGPGSAVWVNEETQEKVEVFPGTAAPDGTAAPGQGTSGGQAAGGAGVDGQQASGQTAGGSGTTGQQDGGVSGGQATEDASATGSAGADGAQAGNAADGASGVADGTTGTASQQASGQAAGSAGADNQQDNGQAASGSETAGQQDGSAGADSQQTSGAAAQPENPNIVVSNGREVDLTKPMVALTYDDGPNPAVGNLIMDELAKVGGRATFFMVGNRVAANKAEVQRMANEGHEVANHSWDHQYFNKLGAASIRSEVAKTNEAIAAACGVTPKLMRLPGGNITDTVRANVDLPMIYWSIDTLDWKTRNAQKTVDAVLGKVQDGDIVLMHELWPQTGTASQTIIPELAKRGYQLVTVSELAQFKGHTLGLGKQYSSFR